MAKAATDEQIQLRRQARRRLIGAIALVTLLAVILPWILEGEPQHSGQEISIQIPSPDSSSPSTNALSARPQERVEKPDEAPKAGTLSGKAAEGDTGTRALDARGDELRAEQEGIQAPPAAAASVPAQDEPPAAKDAQSPPTEAKKRPAERHDSSGEGKQFVVQIAALADAEKANAIRRQLAAKGLKAYTEVVKTASGDVTRVRIGPFSSKQSAEQMRTKLKALGYDGNVTPRK
jgi:DedD protein